MNQSILLDMIRDQSIAETQRRRDAAKFKSSAPTEPADDLFTIHTANRWLELQSQQPEPQMLFGNFWHQEEICILFADTNLGKSILAVQLGHEIARGAALEPFANKTPPAKVLYIDFELSPNQFRSRYHERHATHNFAANLYRAEFNTQAQMPPQYKTFEQYISIAVESAIKRTGAQVLIIDNISCLRNGTTYGTTNEALQLMQQLKTLRHRYNLSILVLAHTPKRNPANPINANDLQGSAMLMNHADSAFAIGQSHTQPGLRYLKQIKQRTGRETYGAPNVCLFQLTKQYGYLSFQFTGYAHEYQHLRRHTQSQQEHLRQQARQHRADGLSQRQTAVKMNLSPTTINRLLNPTHTISRKKPKY